MQPDLKILWRIALIVLVTVAVISFAGLRQLQVDSHYSAYFDKSDPRLIATKQIEDKYGLEDSLFIALASGESFLQCGNYQLLEDVVGELARANYVSGAAAITELGILGENTSDDGYPLPSYQQLVNETRATGLLLSDDQRVAGISLQVSLADPGSKAVLETMADVRARVDRVLQGSSVNAHFTGTLALNEAYLTTVREDLGRIMPLLLLAMMLVLGLLLGSVRAVLTLLPIGIFSVITSFAIAGLLHWPLAAINAFAPIILVSISLAGCVHMALSYSHYRDEGAQPVNAARAAVKYNLLPMALANGTTAAGFLGLVLSPSPPVRVMGYLVASGILVSFLLCMTLLPVLQASFDPWKPGDSVALRLKRKLSQLGRWVQARQQILIALFIAVSLPAAWLASKNVVSDNVLGYFSGSHPFHRDTQLVDESLSGINEVLYSVETDKLDGVFDATAVQAVDRFSSWLQQQPEVKRVLSASEIKPVRDAMSEGRLQQRLDYYRENSRSESVSLSLEVSKERSALLVRTYLQDISASQLIAFDERAKHWVRENLQSVTLLAGGATLMFAHLGEQNVRGMLLAFTAALIGATLIIGVVFRSWRLAGTGLVCNLLPVLLVYSAWALFNGQISLGAAVVMGMILGIVLDDSIYLLASYQRAQQRAINPVLAALRRVGPALMITTLTLVAGLAFGLMSDFGPIWNMSLLSVAIIGTALLVDLLLLPALLTSQKHSASAS